MLGSMWQEYGLLFPPIIFHFHIRKIAAGRKVLGTGEGVVGRRTLACGEGFLNTLPKEAVLKV